MTLHFIGASEVIISPNKRIIALFHYFFLQIEASLKSVEKHTAPQLQDPLFCAFHRY